jgi:hypothetical protein
MSQPSRATSARAALLAAGLALAAASAQATRNFTIPIGTCSPANVATLQYDLRLTNGAVRKAGRNPPSSVYFCEVPDDLAAAPTEAPTWNRFEFQFIDKNTTGNGNLMARLMRKSLSTGAAVEVVRVSSTPSSTLRTAGVSLPAKLDVGRYKHFVIIVLKTPLAEVEAHTVRLVTR